MASLRNFRFLIRCLFVLWGILGCEVVLAEGAAKRLVVRDVDQLRESIDEVRQRRSAGEDGLFIIQLVPGTYRLREPLELDAATVKSGLLIETLIDPSADGTASDERAILSGAVQLEAVRDGEVWRYRVGEDRTPSPTTLLIDGQLTSPARWPREGYHRIEAALPDRRSGFTVASENRDLSIDPARDRCELVLLHDWSASRLPVASYDRATGTLKTVGPIGCEADHYAIDHFERQPRYYLQGDRSFATREGDWYYDRSSQEIVLVASTQQPPMVELPVATTLIQSVGGEPLKNLTLKRLEIRGTIFPVPEGGLAGAQATMHEPRNADGTRAGRGRPMLPAAVQLDITEGCRIEDCRFTQLGGSGLWLGRQTARATVRHCQFKNIGGNGINLGENNDRQVEGRRWYEATPEAISTDNRIEGNEIALCGRLMPGAVAVWVPLSRRVSIKNNHIHDCPYTGISLGWMWNDRPTPAAENAIESNRIEFVMQTLSDGGGVYTLGRQPGSRIADNTITDVPLNRGRAESNAIFCDEGTTGFEITGNTMRRIGKSPLRFHKAGRNRAANNHWELGEGIEPARYNNTPPENIELVDNEVIPPQQSVYLIGNSLTWDTVPSSLDGNVHWHVDCGKSLTYIFDHPGSPCVPSSRLWPLALATTQYDYLSVQPHYGTTIPEDVATISKWIDSQRSAIIVLHTGWARDADFVSEWNDDDPAGPLTHSDAYMDALVTQIKERYPNRQVRSTEATQLLAAIQADIDAGTAPLESRTRLYRDAIHMTQNEGRFLMHNAIRRALDQPLQTDWLDLDDEVKRYLLEKVRQLD